MSTVDLVPIVDEGLGNSAYLLDLGDGRALVVDVSRDLREVHRVAEQRGLSVAYAAETHLHADFLSGACELSATQGTRVLASATGDREFAHTALRDGDEVDLGGLRLRVLATPGHTHEHLSFLLLDGERAVGVFTGGSLIVGAAARTDLMGPEQTEALARDQYASLQRLAALPNDLAVWPTHGAGSFCSAPPGMQRTSTIGQEKTTNPLLGAADGDTFVAALLGSLGSFPPYFLRLAEINRRGPAVLGDPGPLPLLDVDTVRAYLADGAQLIDTRPVADFAMGHVPGALSIPLRPVFASWLGWLAPPDRPLIIVRGADQDPTEIAWQARKIGYETAIGELAGGFEAWTSAGGTTASTPLLRPNEVDNTCVLDIRQTTEYRAGHLPGAVHIELGELMARAQELPTGPVVVMCGHGERAMGGASLLERVGRRQVAVLDGGPEDWAHVTSQNLETGS